jgi:hypothetical protein
MRYQQPIYIQNENSAVRNKDILNVNMSSDICIFVAPEFTMSGASKIDCGCYCTPDFTLLEGGVCQFVDSVSATTYGTFYTGYTGSQFDEYCENGTNFYKSNLTGILPYFLNSSGLIKDGTSATTINPDINVNTGSLWDSNGTTLDGRLNDCGIWAEEGGFIPGNEWIGFSKCLNLTRSGIYSVGLAADNRVRFKINGEFFYIGDQGITQSFTYWRVFEVTLSAGTNVIEMEGYNDNDATASSFGAEIYDATIEELTGLTSTSQLTPLTIFTTKDFRYDETGIPVLFDLGQSSGYSCPAGYFLNKCGTAVTCSILVESGCTVPTGEYHIIDSATTIPITFDFTGNVETFTANSATFNYEIYKYNPNSNTFSLPSVYKSDIIQYSGFSGTSAVTQNVPVSSLSLDGQYLIKLYYQFNNCTDFLGRLGKTINTLSFRSGVDYGLYNGELDYYFTAFRGAEKPDLLNNGFDNPQPKKLFQEVILPQDGESTIVISNSYDGFFMLTLNGLVLAKDEDFSVSGNIVTLSSSTVVGDVITVIYTTGGSGNKLVGDNINVSSSITSGTTDNQGSNKYYYNTDTSKYEIYSSIEPESGGSILVMINGITLANDVDYYQSITNPKRIILEGDLMVGDIITIVYFPIISLVNGISTNKPVFAWSINNPPQLSNGTFTLEVSTGETFNTLYSAVSQSYVVNQSIYSDSVTLTGDIGTKLYVRVKNEKDFVTVCDSVITDIKYSETIPVIIQSNAINSY